MIPFYRLYLSRRIRTNVKISLCMQIYRDLNLSGLYFVLTGRDQDRVFWYPGTFQEALIFPSSSYIHCFLSEQGDTEVVDVTCQKANESPF